MKLVVLEGCLHDVILLGGMIRFSEEAREAAREARSFSGSEGVLGGGEAGRG